LDILKLKFLFEKRTLELNALKTGDIEMPIGHLKGVLSLYILMFDSQPTSKYEKWLMRTRFTPTIYLNVSIKKIKVY
jgi:hypothetical protein